MKIIAFFSEKGGVGKSTFTLMYASWLKKHGVKVGVADFNKRLTEYRKDEIAFLKKNGTFDDSMLESAWPIIPVDRKFAAQFGADNPGNAIWLDTQIREGGLRDLDVLLVDLPGATSGKELPELIICKMLNMIIIPVEKDRQTLGAALAVKNFLIKANTCRFFGFINKIQTSYGKKADYVKIMRVMKRQGLPMLPDMVSFSSRMENFEKVDMMRSTFAYPDWDLPAYKGSRDLGIENLFYDIAREMLKVSDYRDTRPADLSFVESLKKDTSMQSLNRQLNDTSFPEYEIELSEDMKTRFKKNR
ncbi:MAG: P-loop NTPase [Bacteroidales bacterium]|nr:P-loop NTPase [Bacteroidales bacterium]